MFDTLAMTAEAVSAPIRRLHPRDAGRIAAFVTALDRDTLHLRFGRFMSAEAIETHYAELDWDAAVLLAWGNAPEIRGVAEVFSYRTVSPNGPDSIEAEIALVVARDWRGRGIGSLLLQSGIAAAAGQGAGRSTMLLSARNHALSRLARRLGFTFGAEGDRVVLQQSCAFGDR